MTTLVRSAWTHLGGKRATDRPSHCESLTNRCFRQSRVFSPPSDSQSLAVKAQPAVASAVPTLLHSCGPDNIARDVAGVIVDALDGMPRRWLRADVRPKRLNVVYPLWGHDDASATVPMVLGTILVVAARLNVLPCPVNWVSRKAVTRCHYRSQFALQAAATRSATSAQVAKHDAHHGPAITQALPQGIRVGSDQSERHEPPVSLSGNVHIPVTHVRKLYNAKVADVKEMAA